MAVEWMPISYLNDKQIRNTECRTWDATIRRLGRGKDRDRVDAYKDKIRRKGAERYAVQIAVDDRSFVPCVGDGHHRLVAFMELGMTEFPYTWCWIKSYSTPDGVGPFPYKETGLL